eukprot:883675_1
MPFTTTCRSYYYNTTCLRGILITAVASSFECYSMDHIIAHLRIVIVHESMASVCKRTGCGLAWTFCGIVLGLNGQVRNCVVYIGGNGWIGLDLNKATALFE